MKVGPRTRRSFSCKSEQTDEDYLTDSIAWQRASVDLTIGGCSNVGSGRRGGLARQRTGGLAQVHFLLARPFDAGRQLDRLYLSKMCGRWQKNRIWMVPCKRASIAVPISGVGVLPTDFISRMWGGVLFVTYGRRLPSMRLRLLFSSHFTVCLPYLVFLFSTNFSFSFSGEAIKKKRKVSEGFFTS